MEVIMTNRFNYDDEKIFGEKEDGISYVIREGVYGVVFNDMGQVAVIKNPFGYFLPGGGLEDGEDLKQCLIREFIEETGYSITIKNFIGKASKYYFSEAFNHYRHPIGFFYIVDLEKRVTDSIEKDHELLWMEPSDIVNYLYEHQVWAVNEALNIK
jgi:ADP-ribose pyrophosphatase